eukprot:TRINITY_DN3295_c0_g1_i1.p1 TRINITY_DN3295_c0_g1~~TRINITY_DN3295_c0_g1_i1.p1  ORF type:complete len:145 (-),score=24.66 TRINITY_DN3295_c0_g1_i1:22-456(-)
MYFSLQHFARHYTPLREMRRGQIGLVRLNNFVLKSIHESFEVSKPHNKPMEEKPLFSQTQDEFHISLMVTGTLGEVYFKIKRWTPLGRLMTVYCQRQGVDPRTVRFIYHGKRITDDQTANDLDMQDEDIIDANIIIPNEEKSTV